MWEVCVMEMEGDTEWSSQKLVFSTRETVGLLECIEHLTEA